INHSDVTNIQIRIDAARNAAEENVADIESVDRQLRIHSSVDHADTAQQYNDRPFFECPGKKFHPIDGMAVDAFQQASQYWYFGFKCRDDSDPCSIVKPTGRLSLTVACHRQEQHQRTKSAQYPAQ